MQLFELLLELIEQLFLEFIRTQSFKRAMRLRLVSRQFKIHTTCAIFQSRILDRVASFFSIKPTISISPWASYIHDREVSRLGLKPTTSLSPWALFLQRYLAYRILLSVDKACKGGHIHLIAHKIGELTNETSKDFIHFCIVQLCGLEFLTNGSAFNLLRSLPKPTPTAEKFAFDLLDAAVYLNNIPLVKQLLSKEPSLGWGRIEAKDDPLARSKLQKALYHSNPNLERRLQIATYNGNLDMIKILLSADITLDLQTCLPKNLQAHFYQHAGRGTEGHREIFNWALTLTNPMFLGRWGHEGVRHYRAIGMDETPFVECFAGAALLLGRNGKGWWGEGMDAYFDMVRFCLQQRVWEDLAFEEEKEGAQWLSQLGKALLVAAEMGWHEIVKLLLDHGADPNTSPNTTPLMSAVHRNHLTTVKILKENGADVNQGYPPPIALAVRNENVEMCQYLRESGALLNTVESGAWAMGFAEFDDLDAMVEWLCEEGVESGVNLCWVGGDEERYGYFC